MNWFSKWFSDESEDERTIRKMFETHEAGPCDHPVLGHLKPSGFGWSCQFSDTTTLGIPVSVTFDVGNPVSSHDEDNYIQIRARFPALLKAWHTDYRRHRAKDDEIYGPLQVLHLDIHVVREIIGPETEWRIAASAEPYEGDWEFDMKGWELIETVGGVG